MRIIRLLIISLLLFFVLINITLADDFNIEETSNNFETSSHEYNCNLSSDKDLHISSKRAVVLERNSKIFLYEKNSDEKCAMASTTKIMTCLLILENCDLADTVSISKKAAQTGGSRLDLSEGDIISVNDLLYGLMLCSGNDAAVALAEFCSGSIEEFAKLMNSRASELGLSSTHFVTPHGLDNENHYTNAKDFAILTDFTLNNPLFLQIVGTKSYTITINSNQKSISNTNELLGNIDSVYGVKTGFTSQAGRCLITSAKQNNLDIIVVVFGADTKSIRTTDSANLINYIFSNYTAIRLKNLIETKYEEYTSYVLPYKSIEKASCLVSSYCSFENIPEIYPIKNELLDSITVSVEENTISFPIQKDQVLAKINVSSNNSCLYSIDILSESYIDKKKPFDYLLFFFYEYKNFYKI